MYVCLCDVLFVVCCVVVVRVVRCVLLLLLCVCCVLCLCVRVLFPLVYACWLCFVFVPFFFVRCVLLILLFSVNVLLFIVSIASVVLMCVLLHVFIGLRVWCSFRVMICVVCFCDVVFGLFVDVCFLCCCDCLVCVFFVSVFRLRSR